MKDVKLPAAKVPNTPCVVHNANYSTERVTLSERDTRLWIDLLKNPPKANARLISAAQILLRIRC